MVGKICTVCKQSSVANKNLSFFTYPSDKQRRYEWLKAVDRLDLFEKLVDNKSRGNHRICEAHFQDNFIKKCDGLTKSRKYLTKDASPCLEHVNQAWTAQLSGAKTAKQKKKHCLRKTKSVKMDKVADFENVDIKLSSELIIDIEPITEIIPTHKIKIERLDDDGAAKPTSPELNGFPDMSQFCESVIKVCKETQTPQQEMEDNSKKTRKRKLDPIETNENFLQSCSKNLPKGMLQIIKWQMNSKENVDSYKFHMFALNLYFSGANAYNFLKEMMGLPPIEAIKKLLIPKSTKMDNGLINVLKLKVCNMSAREKICCVSIGTMQLKPNLYYNIKRDKVEGLYEVDGVQKIEPAKYAVVFFVQGILEKWTQPVAHAFITKQENCPDISVWVEEIITLLIDLGLDVKAFVSDPKTESLYMLESQRVTPEKPYFSINNKIIYYIYDTTQMQKTVKNFLKSCTFHVDGNRSKCSDNTEFATKFNNLCNILNTTTSKSTSPFQRAYTGLRYHKRFLEEMTDTFSNLKVIRKADGLEIKNMKFVDCILISIKSVMLLFDELKKIGANRLGTTRLNQSRLNKFFAKTSTSKKGCTSREFRQSFARCFVYNMLKKPKGDCKETTAEGFSPHSLLSLGKTVAQSIKVGTTDYRLALPEKKRFAMVCRYLYLKCIDHHSCDKFKDYLSRSPESRQYVAPYRSSAPLDIRNCKLNPPQHFTDFITILEKRFRDYCKQDIKVSSIGQQILKKIASFEFKAPCECFPLDYLKKLFVRLRIYYAVRENNVELKKDKCKLFSTFNL